VLHGFLSRVFLRLLFAGSMLAPAAVHAANPIPTNNIFQKASIVRKGTYLGTTMIDDVGGRFAVIINCKITQFHSPFNSR